MLKSILDAVMERRARRLVEHVGAWLPAEGPVLDLGSGTGHVSARLERELGLEVVTTDVSDLHVVGRPPVVIADGVLPFVGGTFSAALLFFMLAYPNDPAGVLSEAARVTRGPIILVQSLHSGRLGYAWLRVREFLWTIVAFHVSKILGYVPPDAEFTMKTRRFYTAQELQRDVMAAGLQIRSRRERPVLPGHSLVVAAWVLEPAFAQCATRASLASEPRDRSEPAQRRARARVGESEGRSPSEMFETRLSFVIPARNEEALIGEALEAILASVARASSVYRHDLWLPDTSFEVIVADDASEDATAAVVGSFADDVGVRLVRCAGGTCAAARNAGAAAASGRVLCFVDADTIVPKHAVDRILELHEGERRCLVLYRLASREPGIRAWLWWSFWGLARHVPLARAKSMPAFMSCDRAHFERYGPFNESCAIAEEWPLTVAAYRYHQERFLYDRSLTARTSSRRMELQPFGYLRTFLRWGLVVLFRWARTSPVDLIRHETGNR
jgi:SAM-dependent methyltransferase